MVAEVEQRSSNCDGVRVIDPQDADGDAADLSFSKQDGKRIEGVRFRKVAGLAEPACPVLYQLTQSSRRSIARAKSSV